MAIVPVLNVGEFGVNKDLSNYSLPMNAWSDANNIRFLDGTAQQFYGYSDVYATPSFAPQYLLNLTVSGVRYWVYATATKCYAVKSVSDVVTHTDITHVTPRTGIVNNWTGTVFSGIPILNTGDITSVPMSWDTNIANKFVNLAAWPAGTYCKSIRSYKNFLIALNITKTTTNYPSMIKWSHPADPGSIPSSWDITDTTKEAGEFDLSDGSDAIVDGFPLRDYFIIYKESSTWRMAYTGGSFVFSFNKIFGMSGILNKNCMAEFDGWHLVVTGSDIIIHDGQSSTSVLDKQARRNFFQNLEAASRSKVFVFKNPYLNEIYIAYPKFGATSCNAALVYNYSDKTVTYRDLPNLNHAAYGFVDTSTNTTWEADTGTWDADLSLWNGGDYTPDSARVVMASEDVKLYLLDGSATSGTTTPTAYLERIGLAFDQPDTIKLIKGVRPRIYGTNGATVLIKIGGTNDPYQQPTYTIMTHTIGSTISNDCLVSGRYISIRFESGTAAQWRLDSYDFDVDQGGKW
jgi:hypothetical protein